jgi:sugar phosphate permease
MTDSENIATPPSGLHRAWVVAFAGAAAVFCGLGLARFAFGMMLPSMSASVGLNYSQGGLLGFANMAGYLVAVLMTPLVLPRIGTRMAMTTGLILIALSMLGMALSERFLALCALYVLTGIGSGAVVLPAMSLMSPWFHPSHRGLAAGIVMSGPGFGIILTGFVVPQLVPFHGLLSWQSGWLVFAIITCLVAVMTFALIRNHPHESGHLPYGRVAQAPLTQASASPRAGRARLLAHLGLIFAIYGATYMLYVTFIVTSMVDNFAMSQAGAGELWAWFGFLSIFSGVLFGWVSDRIGRRAGMGLAFAVLASAYLLVGFGTWMPGLYVSIILFGLAAWGVPVIMAATAGDYFGPAGAANALAALTLAFSAGQALGPVGAGLLAERTGDFSSSYAAAGAAAVMAILLIMLLKAPR